MKTIKAKNINFMNIKYTLALLPLLTSVTAQAVVNDEELATETFTISGVVKPFDANCTLTVPPIDLGKLAASPTGKYHFAKSEITVSVTCDQDVSYRLFTNYKYSTHLYDDGMIDESYPEVGAETTLNNVNYKFAVYADRATNTIDTPNSESYTGFLNRDRQSILGSVKASATTNHKIHVGAFVEDDSWGTKEAISETFTFPIVMEVME